MNEVIEEWAGRERTFRLQVGQVLDIEEACGGVGIGEIFLRMGQGRYTLHDVMFTLRFGLIGGGMESAEAKRLIAQRFDTVPLITSWEVAHELLITLMSGVPPKTDDAATGDPSEPHNAGEIFAAFVQLGIAPQDVRGMRYADFVRLCRALPGGDKAKVPSEAEFDAMVERAIEMGAMDAPKVDDL